VFFSNYFFFPPPKKRKEHLVNGTRILPSGSLVGGGEREGERNHQTKPNHTTTPHWLREEQPIT